MVYLERSRRPLPGILHVENVIWFYISGLNVILFTPITKCGIPRTGFHETRLCSSELCAGCRYRIQLDKTCTVPVEIFLQV